jgi:BMFP domain-containing protein YqiC
MAERYDGVQAQRAGGLFVLAADFDAQVDAGMKLFEENERLRSRIAELEKRVTEVNLEMLVNETRDGKRIDELEAALTEIAEKLHPETWHNIGCGIKAQKIARAALAVSEPQGEKP